MSPSVSQQMHRADVRAYAKHHGRVSTWLFDQRRLIVLAVIVMPLCILVAASAPWLMIGFGLVAMMAAAVAYKTHRNWRDD